MDTVSNTFHKMRRHDRELDQASAVKILSEGEYGVLSTYGEDGWPYGVPLSYAYEDGKLYFHGAKTGHKLSNLQACDRASFTVVGRTHVLQEIYSTAYQSAIAFGTVRVVTEAAEKKHGLLLLAEKYCYDNFAIADSYAERSLNNVCVYCMEIIHLTGKERPEQK